MVFIFKYFFIRKTEKQKSIYIAKSITICKIWKRNDLDMVEVLNKSRITNRNLITIPVKVRQLLNLFPGDLIRWELNDNGCVAVYKVVTHRVNNRCNTKFEGGGENGEKDTA